MLAVSNDKISPGHDHCSTELPTVLTFHISLSALLSNRSRNDSLVGVSITHSRKLPSMELFPGLLAVCWATLTDVTLDFKTSTRLRACKKEDSQSWQKGLLIFLIFLIRQPVADINNKISFVDLFFNFHPWALSPEVQRVLWDQTHY